MRSYNTKEIDLERVGAGIEFNPTHTLIGTKNAIAPMVMELSATRNGLTLILYEDGTRGKVFPSNLVPLSEEKIR